MWRPPYERSLPPPPPPPPSVSRHHAAHPSGPPPPHSIIRGYSNELPPYGHEIRHHRGVDPYHHRPIYRPPPHHPRYDYSYAPPPPSYNHRFRPAPHVISRPYYRDGPLVEEFPGSTSLPMIGGGCTCKKSKCLKLYCQCFSSSTTCGPKCKCQACHNTTMHRQDIEDARKVILERNPAAFELKHYPAHPSAPTPPISPSKTGCKCRRSFCLKKYCECFNHGVKCNASCRCVNCRNQAGPETPGTAGPYVQAQKPSPHRVNANDPTLAIASSPEMTITTPTQSRTAPSPPVTVVSTSTVENSISEKPPEDRMAIMAAVAMTELLGGNKRERPSDDVTTEKNMPEAIAKRIKTEDPQGMHSIVSATSSDASSPETVRKSPQASPKSPQASYTQYSGNYYRSAYSPPSRPYCPKVYEETTRLSGLPKSLSFRKICSKCGKTRGEHGELGFGHRCVYQDCGKCGAGVQMHIKAGVPMGILCTLTEKDGAIPGKARAYERKIQDLAIRAELQQKLQQQRVVKV